PLDDRFDIVDAAAPGSSTDGLQRGPEARVVGKIGIGREVGPGRAGGENARAFFRPEARCAVTDEVDAAFEPVAVNDDLDQVAVQHLAYRAACQRLRPDMAD